MRVSLPLVVPVLAVPLSLLVPTLQAQQEVGKVIELQGRLTETQLWDGATRQLELEDPVRTGTRLETGQGSRAALLVNGKTSVLEMGESTRIESPPPGPGAEEEETTGWWKSLHHLVGRIRVFFTDPSRAFSVETPQGHIAARNTAFAVEADTSRTLVWSFEGRVQVTSLTGGAAVVLSAGEMTVVRRGRRPTPPTPFDPESGATASGAVPPNFDRPPEEHSEPPLFPVPEELPPRRGIDPPGLRGGG